MQLREKWSHQFEVYFHIWNLYIIHVGFISLVHYFSYVCSPRFLKTSFDSQHIGEAMLYFPFGATGNWISSEPWMKFPPHRHQCPWLLWYTISFRIPSWVLASFILDLYWTRGRSKNVTKLVNLGAPTSSLPSKLHIFHCMGKVPFEIPHEIPYPYIEIYDFYAI